VKASGQELRLKGHVLSEGVVVGQVCLFNEIQPEDLPAYEIDAAGVEQEIERLHKGIAVAVEQLKQVRQRVAERIGNAEAGIFVAQRTILEDPSLQKEIIERIRGKRDNAEVAVALVLDSYEQKLLELDDEYIRERASDIGEVRRRLLDAIAGGKSARQFQCAESACAHGHDRVVVAIELTPGSIVALDLEHTRAFVTERGGVNSHAAILARALGIPAVSGIENVRQLARCESRILVDGFRGEVVLCPRPETVEDALAREKTQSEALSGPATPMAPVEGFRVMANINLPGELDEALAMQAEGIGLYRTEFEVIAAGRMFSEDELYKRYARIVEAMKGATTTFRLLDVGSDKRLPFMRTPREENPALGWRGARLLLGNRELLATQARALARASRHGAIHVLYPMIVDREQFLSLRTHVLDAIDGIERGELYHGVMLEVPAACLQADELLEEADFASVGTNDLIQYLFAVDRDNKLVAADYSPDRPALWRLLRIIAEAGKKSGKPVSVCGELAGDPDYVAKLLNAGIDCVSTTARRIPRVRRAAQTALRPSTS